MTSWSLFSQHVDVRLYAAWGAVAGSALGPGKIHSLFSSNLTDHPSSTLIPHCSHDTYRVSRMDLAQHGKVCYAMKQLRVGRPVFLHIVVTRVS